MFVISKVLAQFHAPKPETVGKIRRAAIAGGLTVGAGAGLLTGAPSSAPLAGGPAAAPAPITTPAQAPASSADLFRTADGKLVSFKLPTVFSPEVKPAGPMGPSADRIEGAGSILPRPLAAKSKPIFEERDLPPKPAPPVSLLSAAEQANEVNSVYSLQLPQLKASPEALEAAAQAEAQAVKDHLSKPEATAAVHKAVEALISAKADQAGITPAQLKAIFPRVPDDKVDVYTHYINLAMLDGDVNTKPRQAFFLGQMAEETAGLDTLVEYDSGAAYNNRPDLGNTDPGDGERYKGRGGFQTTGETNYGIDGKAVNRDLVNNPELAADPSVAFLTAVNYWIRNNLSAYADRGDVDGASVAINGGTNGIEVRREDVSRATQALG
jgi:putative chitinase